MKIRILLSVLLIAAAAALGCVLAAPDPPAKVLQIQSGIAKEESRSPQEPPREGYLLRDYRGRLAVVKAGEKTPEMIFDVYTKTLPEADQSMLAEGIYVESYEELLSLIEDYVS